MPFMPDGTSSSDLVLTVGGSFPGNDWGRSFECHLGWARVRRRSFHPTPMFDV